MNRKPEHSISYKQAAKMLRVRDAWNAVDREEDSERKAALTQRARDEGVPRQVAHSFTMNDQRAARDPDHRGPTFYWPEGEVGRLRLKTPEEFARTRPPDPEPHGSEDA